MIAEPSKSISSRFIRVIFAPLFILFTLSACMTSPVLELDAYVNKSTITEYDSLTYTVVYQGYAEEYELKIDDINYGYRNYYTVLDSDHSIAKTIVNNEEKFVTTWNYELAVYEHGDRTIPSIGLKGLSTPTVTFHVNDAGSDQDWVTWQNAFYKQDLAVNEKIIILTRVTASNPDFTMMDEVSPIVPTEEYQDINVHLQFDRSFYSNRQRTINLFTEISFDKPGEYSFSHVGILGLVKDDNGKLISLGSDAPTLHFTVK